MSVSIECKPGLNDIIYFIDECCVSFVFDERGQLVLEHSINFNIGDKVTFLEWYEEKVGCNQMTMIKFIDDQGRIFSAIESYFVTEDRWDNLKNYFLS